MENTLRLITYGELHLMFMRLAIDMAEHPDWYEGGKKGITEFIEQENFRRKLFVKPETDGTILDEFEVFYKHPDGTVLSGTFTAKDLVEKDGCEIEQTICTCDCKPIGETNVVECNCEDYYQEFKLLKVIPFKKSGE